VPASQVPSQARLKVPFPAAAGESGTVGQRSLLQRCRWRFSSQAVQPTELT
jgi:hypothetical protein